MYTETYKLWVTNRTEGPRDLGKYKLSSDYWENWPLVKDLDVLKDFINIKVSKQEPKKSNAFFLGVLLFSFLPEIFSTLLTLHCLKCLFHMNNHIDQVVNVMFVEKFFNMIYYIGKH